MCAPSSRNNYIQGLERELLADPGKAGWNVSMLQLPQSVHYSDQANRRYDGELYATLSKLHFSIASRDPNGVALGRETFNVPVYPCPDIAFMMGPAQAGAKFFSKRCRGFVPPSSRSLTRNSLRRFALFALLGSAVLLSWVHCAPYAAQLRLGVALVDKQACVGLPGKAFSVQAACAR